MTCFKYLGQREGRHQCLKWLKQTEEYKWDQIQLKMQDMFLKPRNLNHVPLRQCILLPNCCLVSHHQIADQRLVSTSSWFNNGVARAWVLICAYPLPSGCVTLGIYLASLSFGFPSVQWTPWKYVPHRVVVRIQCVDLFKGLIKGMY